MMPADELWRSQESVSCPYSPKCLEGEFSEVGQPSCSVLLGVFFVHPPDRLGLGLCEVPSLPHIVYGVVKVRLGTVAQTGHHPSLVAAAQIPVVALGDMVPGPPRILALQNRRKVLPVHGL